MHKKPSLAIISNYGSLCGISGYTYWLKKQLSVDFEIEVLSLDQNLLKRKSRNGVRAGNYHIKELANRLPSFEYVNIQFEPGTLGPDLYIAYRRFCILLKKSPNMTITFHTVVRDQQENWGERIKPLLKGRIKKGLTQIAPDFSIRIWEKIYKVVKKYERKKRVAVIVHTKRDADFFKVEKKFSYVFDHPLAFLSEDDIQDYKSHATRSSFSSIKDLDPRASLIGVFGFIAPYKGILTAIRALSYLPPDYHLLIFGGVHPNELKHHQSIFTYLQEVQSEVETEFLSEYQGYSGTNLIRVKKNIKGNRIHFMGALDDPEFVKGMALCDYVVFPYEEVGQSASGPISMALEVGSPMLVTRNLMTKELKKYFPAHFQEFDIGAYLQLAEYILYDNVITPKEGLYNWRTNRKAYLQAITGESQE